MGLEGVRYSEIFIFLKVLENAVCEEHFPSLS